MQSVYLNYPEKTRFAHIYDSREGKRRNGFHESAQQSNATATLVKEKEKVIF
jgi:hypothetical protein